MQTKCRALSTYNSINSYYKWTFKVPFWGWLYTSLQSRVVAYMNHRGSASSEGQQYSGWIKHEVHTTRSLVIIHCQATRRAVMLKSQHLLWLHLTQHTAAIKSLTIINMTPRNTGLGAHGCEYLHCGHLGQVSVSTLKYTRTESNLWPSTNKVVFLTKRPLSKRCCECAKK